MFYAKKINFRFLSYKKYSFNYFDHLNSQQMLQVFLCFTSKIYPVVIFYFDHLNWQQMFQSLLLVPKKSASTRRAHPPLPTMEL
jgi:hypothetical protein